MNTTVNTPQTVSERFEPAHEVEVGVLRQFAREACREGEVLPLVALHLAVIDKACHVDCGEERAAQTDDKRYGEATDGAAAEHGKDDTGDD